MKKINKKKTIFSLVSSLLSIFMCLLLLITTIFAWYTSNKNVSANGITASTASDKNVYVSTTYDGSTAVSSSNLDSCGFSKKIILGLNQSMYPVSSSDGSTFFVANLINMNGTADIGSSGGFSIASSSYYYEKTFYFCSGESTAVTMYCNNVSISQGNNGSDIYKAVRVSLDTNSNISIFKHASGSAKPASSTTATVSTDPADDAGRFNYSSDAFQFSIPANYTVVSITVRVWIEGQDSYAITDNSGDDFKLKLEFNTAS